MAHTDAELEHAAPRFDNTQSRREARDRNLKLAEAVR